MPNGADAQRKCSRGEPDRVIVNGIKLENDSKRKEGPLLETSKSTYRSSDTNIVAIQGDQYCIEEANQPLNDRQNRKNRVQMASDCDAVDAANLSDTCEVGSGAQQPRVLSQLIVESSASGSATATTLSKTTAPTKLLASCDNEKPIHQATLAPIQRDIDVPRSASSCGALGHYADDEENNYHMGAERRQPKLDYPSMTVSQDFLDKSALTRVRRSLASGLSEAHMMGGNNPQMSQEKRISDLAFPTGRGRSMGGGNAMPLMSAKMQAAQRQISQNETTTRLLIAVMIVFLICELPAGILAALCAILGQDFFENVYQPTGTLTDLLALINSSVNFILYCFMSTQFRVTFYRVVLHCPAPNAPQHHQAMLMSVNNNNNNINNLTNVNKDRSPKPAQQNRELNNY